MSNREDILYSIERCRETGSAADPRASRVQTGVGALGRHDALVRLGKAIPTGEGIRGVLSHGRHSSVVDQR